MRIKVKTLRTLVFTGILAVGAIFAGGMITRKVTSRGVYGEGEKDYCCGDIVFGNDYIASGNIGTSNPLTTETNKAKVMSVTNEEKLGLSDFDISFSYCYYQNSKDNKHFPIRVGKSGTLGKLTITLKNGMLCDKVLVYAAGYTSHSDPQLDVNDSGFQKISTSTGSTYDFKDSEKDPVPYVYSFAGSSTITFENKAEKQLVLVSKIVFRMYTIA